MQSGAPDGDEALRETAYTDKNLPAYLRDSPWLI